MGFLNKAKLGKVLAGVKSKANAAGFKTDLIDAATNLASKGTSAISGIASAGATVEGVKSLTSGLSGQGISTLTDKIPGLDLITPISGGGDIEKITGAAAKSGFNFAFSGGSGTEAIAGLMSSAQGVLGSLVSGAGLGGLAALAGPLAKISGGAFNKLSIVSELSKKVGDITSVAQSAFTGQLNKLTNVGIGLPIKDLIEKATSNIKGPITSILSNQSALKGLDINTLIGQVDSGKLTDAAAFLNTKMKDNLSLVNSLGAIGDKSISSLTAVQKEALAEKFKLNPALKEEYIEKNLATIPTAVADTVTASNEATKAMGEGTTPIAKLGENDSKWNGDNTGDDYNFSIINSYEELEAEFRAPDRDITEVIVNWTETFTDENLTVKEIYTELASRKNNMHFHYLILRDGSIGKLAPIGEVTKHTSFGGWRAENSTISFFKNDASHNKHSIGVAFVGGLNVGKGDYEDVRNEAFLANIDFNEDLTDYRDGTAYVDLQNNTFDQFMKIYYTVFPGGQAWAADDLTDNTAPGFSVLDYIKQRFNKVNTLLPTDEALPSKELKSKMIEKKNKELNNA
jgi:hypothetical protein